VTTAHEPRRGPGIHLSPDDVSALAEGAQPGAEGAAEHVLACRDCRAEVDAITELLAAFEEFEAPVMPQDVALRVDAALARESAARAALPAPSQSAAASDAASPSTLSKAARPRRGFWRLSPALGFGLAALAVVVGGLSLLIYAVSSSSPVVSSASGSAAERPNAIPKSAQNHDLTRLPATGLLDPSSPLALWVKASVPLPQTGNSVYSSQASTPCVADPRFAGRKLLAVREGTYQGSPAELVVYANGDDTSTVYALAYATPCGPSDFRVLDSGVVAG